MRAAIRAAQEDGRGSSVELAKEAMAALTHQYGLMFQTERVRTLLAYLRDLYLDEYGKEEGFSTETFLEFVGAQLEQFDRLAQPEPEEEETSEPLIPEPTPEQFKHAAHVLGVLSAGPIDDQSCKIDPAATLVVAQWLNLVVLADDEEEPCGRCGKQIIWYDHCRCDDRFAVVIEPEPER